ncbi:DUF262 domain-containing protein [Okeania sp. KiyG1]|uniref:DUF262 domain-containing protein n=1 Tax=Okeania sp. KiyG1 TaxID=2720165 RepID=UPI0019A12AA0|nr:DUF262 domain-containing protein [Okeania sp. KiyG1]GFZ98685.1 hypothetical protein CYANOKiyG1_10070 [Okeania sp. KiyG1]
MPIKIQGTQYNIGDIFCDKFLFSIPLYQRPYDWEEEEAGELLEDLLGCLENSSSEDLNPYFLGSIVLIKDEDSPEAQIIDGQQRLTTLTILLAALREVISDKEYTNELSEFIYQKGRKLTQTPNSYRLTLRQRDADFFRKYIQHEDGISQLENLDYSQLSDSQNKLRNNTLFCQKRLTEISEEQLIKLAGFIIKKCLLVVVSTPDLESAYRIFSVLNDRGRDLSLTDIFKAEIIGNIPDEEKEKYTENWENIEEKLGRDEFENLFSDILMIYRKAKSSEAIIKELREYVKPSDNPTNFIDNKLSPFANAFSNIRNANYQSSKYVEQINTIFKALNQIDNKNWMPPAILYLSKYKNQPEKLLNFFQDFDRLASCLMIIRANINQRIKRYGSLLSEIENGEDLHRLDSALQLKNHECQRIINSLNKDCFYGERTCRYVLLRLDTALSEGVANYDFSTITIEHILPQRPPHNSQWLNWFTTKQRQKYTNCLGNLVLLSCKKNQQASNYEFEEKKQKYFSTNDGVSPFVLTTQVLTENEWTPEIIERRQQKLLEKLKELWRLDI